MGPGDVTFPQHIEKGVGRYARTQQQTQPDFSQLNNMFQQFSNPGLMARGGSWADPSQGQQMATGNYLSARGDVAANSLQNMFAMSALQSLLGKNMGNIAGMIPALEASKTRATGGVFGNFGI